MTDAGHAAPGAAAPHMGAITVDRGQERIALAQARWRRLATALAAAVAACLTWSLWPLAPADLPTAATDSGSRAHSRAAMLAPLDVAAFQAPLWIAAPTPTPAPNPTPTPTPPQQPAVAATPIKLELLGIVSEQGGWRAVLYDPDSDRVCIVGAGEAVGPRVVHAVTARAITLREAGRGPETDRVIALRTTPGEGG